MSEQSFNSMQENNSIFPKKRIVLIVGLVTSLFSVYCYRLTKEVMLPEKYVHVCTSKFF